MIVTIILMKCLSPGIWKPCAKRGSQALESKDCHVHPKMLGVRARARVCVCVFVCEGCLWNVIDDDPPYLSLVPRESCPRWRSEPAGVYCAVMRWLLLCYRQLFHPHLLQYAILCIFNDVSSPPSSSNTGQLESISLIVGQIWEKLPAESRVPPLHHPTGSHTTHPRQLKSDFSANVKFSNPIIICIQLNTTLPSLVLVLNFWTCNNFDLLAINSQPWALLGKYKFLFDIVYRLQCSC